MKKKKITYGVYNIIEWHAALAIGKAKVRVSFTGGAVTTNGVTPATFTTSDPVVQLAIQRSKEYASGKIKIVRSSVLAEDVAVERNSKAPMQKETASAGSIASATAEEDTLKKGQAGTESVENEKVSQNAEEAIVESAGESDECSSESIGEDCKEAEITKSFAINDDAKDYLVEEFGYVRSKLRTRDDIVKAGKSCGVNIVFGV